MPGKIFASGLALPLDLSLRALWVSVEDNWRELVEMKSAAAAAIVAVAAGAQDKEGGRQRNAQIRAVSARNACRGPFSLTRSIIITGRRRRTHALIVIRRNKANLRHLGRHGQCGLAA